MSPKKNILFITYDGLTDPLGRSQILPYLIGLSKRYHITILSCEKAVNYRENRADIELLLDQANISWITLAYKAVIPIWSPYRNYKNLLSVAKENCKVNSFHLIHCRSIIPAMIGHRLQKQFKVNLLVDFRGFWADERVEGKLWNLKNPIFKGIYSFFKKQEEILFESADGIVSLTESAKNYLLSRFKIKNEVVVIPCAVDVDHFSPNNLKEGEMERLRTELNIAENQYVLSYIGSLGTRYLLTEMLRFFNALKKQEKNAILLFVTKTPEKFILEQTDQLGIARSDIRITSTDYNKMPEYINIMQASMFFVTVGFSGKAVSPTKQSEVLSMGKPLIANSGLGDTDSILKNNKLGVVLDAFEEEDLSAAARELLHYKTDAATIRSAAIEVFSLKKAIRSYENIYAKLIGT